MTRTVALLFLVALVPTARADEKVFSGPQVGEKLTAFKALGHSGPEAGKEFDVLAATKGQPTLLIFIHEATRPNMQLLRPVDYYASKLAKDGFAAHIVWLTSDKTKSEAYLTQAKNSLNFKSPVCISLDGLEGPGNYGLNRKMTVTLLVAKDNKVTANFAIVQPNETDAPKVIEAMAKLVNQKAPTLEELRAEIGGPGRVVAVPGGGTIPEQLKQLQDELAKLKDSSRKAADLQKRVDELTDALNEARAKIAKLEGKPAPEPLKKGAVELPGRTPTDQEIIGLMRRMIQPDNDEAKVKEIAADMVKWAGDDAAKKKDLKDFCIRIAHIGYGSDAAKKVIKQMAGD